MRIWKPHQENRSARVFSVAGTQVLCKTWEVTKGKHLLPYVSLQTSGFYSYFDENCIIPNIATLS